MQRFKNGWLCWMLLAVAACVLWHGRTAADEEKTYTLRYRFRPGEVVRWEVEHRATVRTTVGGTTQTAETRSRSLKVWKILKVDAKRITFTNQVQWVQMTQWVTGRERITYDSRRDREPPPGMEHVGRSVGQPLAEITIDPLGHVLRRENKKMAPLGESPKITIPLPEEPVRVGQSWQFDEPVILKREDKTVARVRTRQKLVLKSVEDGVATIYVETILLDPVRDPVIEAQLVQRFTKGWVKFHIARGRILQQQFDLDRRVIGHIGPNSGMHYRMHFVEKLVEGTETDLAGKPAKPAR